MIGLDTNILVRYICRDDAKQTRAADDVIERRCSDEKPGYIHDVALSELVWVLKDSFGYDRKVIGEVLEKLLAARQLRVADPERARQALKLYRKGPADFPDCLISVRNLASGCERTLTFDRRAARVDGMQLLT